MLSEDMIDDLCEDITNLISRFNFCGIVFQVVNDIQAQESLLDAYKRRYSTKKKKDVTLYKDYYNKLELLIMGSIRYHLKAKHLYKGRPFSIENMALLTHNIKIAVLRKLDINLTEVKLS